MAHSFVVAAWTELIVYICVYCPILIYHLHRFQSQQSHIVYSLRYCKITIAQCVILIVKLIFNAIVGMADSYRLYKHNSFIDLTLHAVGAYLTSFFLYCFVWKFWLLRFNIMLHAAVIGRYEVRMNSSYYYSDRSQKYVIVSLVNGKPLSTTKTTLIRTHFT